MIKIKKLERGFALKIDGLYIHQGFSSGQSVKAVIIEPGTENRTMNISVYVSIEGLRHFWRTKRREILEALKHPYIEVDGHLAPPTEKTKTIADAIMKYRLIDH